MSPTLDELNYLSTMLYSEDRQENYLWGAPLGRFWLSASAHSGRVSSLGACLRLPSVRSGASLMR